MIELKEMSVNFQSNNLIKTYTVKNMILFHLWMNDQLNVKNQLSEQIKLWNLDICQNQNIEKISGGEEKKTSLLMTSIIDAKCWFLDEPTNNLDSDAKEILKIL